MKCKYIGLLVLLFTSLFACDSGDIYPEEDNNNDSRLVSVSFIFKNTNTIPVGRERKLALAAFSEQSNSKPIRMARISEANENEMITIHLSKTSFSAKKVALVITDQSSEVICSLYEKVLPEDEKDIEIDGGMIDLASFHRIQYQLFDQSCISCHSKINLSGELNLEEGSSYGMVVNRRSYKYDQFLVEPGYASGSLLLDKLSDYTIGTFHTSLSSMKEEDIDLLRCWIDNGAKNN